MVTVYIQIMTGRDVISLRKGQREIGIGVILIIILFMSSLKIKIDEICRNEKRKEMVKVLCYGSMITYSERERTEW